MKVSSRQYLDEFLVLVLMSMPMLLSVSEPQSRRLRAGRTPANAEEALHVTFNKHIYFSRGGGILEDGWSCRHGKHAGADDVLCGDSYSATGAIGGLNQITIISRSLGT